MSEKEINNMKCGINCRCGLLKENQTSLEGTHKMKDGTIMTGSTHTKKSKPINIPKKKNKKKVDGY